VKPAPGFSVVLTMNGEPNDLDPALLDRFAARVRIDEVHPHALEQLPDYLREVARTLGAEAEPDDRASVRAFETVARVAAVHGLDRALEIVVPQHREQILAAAQLANAAQP
jgi:Mg-chelatase subunit ChlI